MKTIISIMAAFFTALFSITGAFNGATAPEDKSDFVPVVRFMATSDTHCDWFAPQRVARIQKAINLSYDAASKCKAYDKLDAVLFAGDLTDDGQDPEFAAFEAAVKSVLKDGTQFLAITANAHDNKVYDKKTQDILSQMTGLDSDFSIVINGFHFIGISSSKTEGERYSDYQREWLTKELDKATAEDPLKPIFVTHHEHVRDTVYGSSEVDGWGIEDFKPIFEKYPQIIHLSGHSHYPLNDPRSIWQGEFTAVGTGTLNYVEFTVDNENKLHPDNNEKAGQCWIIEVNKDNDVRFRGYDVINEALLCEYIVRNPSDAANRQFTPAQQESASSAPTFDGKDFISSSLTGHTLTLEVPAAKSTDGNIVFLYRAVVTGKDGKEKDNQYVINDYWLSETYDSVTLKVSFTEGDTVNVYAENAYGMRSESIQYK